MPGGAGREGLCRASRRCPPRASPFPHSRVETLYDGIEDTMLELMVLVHGCPPSRDPQRKLRDSPSQKMALGVRALGLCSARSQGARRSTLRNQPRRARLGCRYNVQGGRGHPPPLNGPSSPGRALPRCVLATTSRRDPARKRAGSRNRAQRYGKSITANPCERACSTPRLAQRRQHQRPPPTPSTPSFLHRAELRWPASRCGRRPRSCAVRRHRRPCRSRRSARLRGAPSVTTPSPWASGGRRPGGGRCLRGAGVAVVDGHVPLFSCKCLLHLL